MAESNKPESPTDRDELLQLYKLALEDRNFQVTLNWDRTKHYFIFNFAAFSIAGGLARVAGAFWVQAGLFALVTVNSAFAAYSIKRGHEYYRNARTHVKNIERRLGLDDALAMKSTRGMQRETTGKKASGTDWITIVNQSIALQLLVMVFSAYALVRLFMTR